MTTHNGPFIISMKYYSFTVLLFLFILGSHYLDYYPQLFILAAVLLIDWRKFYSKEVWILIVFLLSIYITLFFLERGIMYNLDKLITVLSQALMLFLAYIIGLSIRYDSFSERLSNERFIFYLLFGFFLAYTASLLCSYIFIPEDNPINREGMYVCFQNEYKRLNINNGNLISTIIAYYLTFSVIILPFVVFYFKEFRKNNFNYLELLLLVGASVFALYLAAEMGRRTVIVLLLLTVLYLSVVSIVSKFKANNYNHIFFLIIFVLLLGGIFYYFFADTMVIERLMSLDIMQIKRFQFWLPGLQAMLDYPFGGGHSVPVGVNMKLAHNTWIDIGKDYGVIPFIISIVFFLMHIPCFLHILFSKTIKSFLKHLFVVLFVCLITIMMIEPVFTSDKTFFFYIIFYLGFLKNYSDCIKSKDYQKS